jgi:hypothetical protein
VDSSATVSTPQALNQSARACKSVVKGPKARTGSGLLDAGTQAQVSRAPISKPAACGCMIFNSSSGLILRRVPLTWRGAIVDATCEAP